MVVYYTMFPLFICGDGDSFRSSWLGVNLVPFRTIKGYFRAASHGVGIIAIKNLLGNVLLLMPLGFLLPLLYEKLRSFVITVMACLLASLSIEFVQIFIGRSVDVDDLIPNTFGAAIGYFSFVIIYKIISVYSGNLVSKG